MKNYFKVPKGYKLVLVPDEPAPNEPDWYDCVRQAELATGLEVNRSTFSIIKREIRRWIAHKETSVYNVPDDFFSHRDSWRQAIAVNCHMTNEDDASYWEHELAAFDRAYSELNKTK